MIFEPLTSKPVMSKPVQFKLTRFKPVMFKRIRFVLTAWGPLLALLLLGGCTFTYIPLVREARIPDPRLNIADESSLLQNDAGLELTLYIATVPEADWVAVQWFDPSNEEVYATSLWAKPAPKTQTFVTTLPPEVTLEDGLWRTVVSYQGRLARQFSLEVRAPQTN